MSNVKQIKINTKIDLDKTNKYPYYYNDNTDEKSNTAIGVIDADEMLDNNSVDIRVYINSNKSYNISFNLEDLPNCCGVKEIGAFNQISGCPTKNVTEVLDACVSVCKGTTFIATTNNSGNNILYANAFAKCKYWTLVKEFKNSNTGNPVKIWMSNNE